MWISRLILIFAIFFVGCASSSPVSRKRVGLFDRFFGKEPQEIEEQVPRDYSGDATRLALRWPLKQIKLTSPFGPRGSDFHEGVDLRAKTGTPVYASQSGRVLYSGMRIRGYGKLIVIRHQKGWSTIYAHNSRLIARVGQVIRKGQLIAISGKSGHAHGPHLHFEIRQGAVAVDPLKLLPPIELARRTTHRSHRFASTHRLSHRRFASR